MRLGYNAREERAFEPSDNRPKRTKRAALGILWLITSSLLKSSRELYKLARAYRDQSNIVLASFELPITR